MKYLVSILVNCVFTKAALMASLVCIAMALASCRLREPIVKSVPVEIHDTVYSAKVVHDSVFIESVVKEYVKGDTVFMTETTTKYIERLKTDTLMVYVDKPTEIVRTETVTVERPLNWLQKALLSCGVAFVFSLLVCAAIFIIGLKKK